MTLNIQLREIFQLVAIHASVDDVQIKWKHFLQCKNHFDSNEECIVFG